MTTPLEAAIKKHADLSAKVEDYRARRMAVIATADKLLSLIQSTMAGVELADRTVKEEQAKEREAKHKAMADELTAVGYIVGQPVEESTLTIMGVPIAKGDTMFLATVLSLYGDLQMYDKGTGKPAGTLATALSGGGKAPGMNTPGSGAGSAKPGPKLGGVHGVGEGWYRPIVYINGVKLEHDFAINTADHHEAGNGWWLKHVPSGKITKDFPNEAEAYRWIKGRMAKRAAGAQNQYYAPHYTTNDPHPEVK